MQALQELAHSTFNYDMHNWGPQNRSNQAAIAQFKAWLKQSEQAAHKQADQGTDDPQRE